MAGMGRNAAAASGLDALIDDILHDEGLGARVVHSAYLPPSPVRYGELDPPLAEPIRQALAGSGVERLWSHQAEGIAAVRRREDVLVTTPTASGKSLVFQLPVLEEALAGRSGRGL